MKTLLFLFLSLPLLAQTKTNKGQVVRLDPRFDKLIPKDAAPEVLATGFEWAEGPVWVKAKGGEPGYLLFSDVPKNTVFRWTEADGCKPFLMPSGYTGRGTYSDEPGSNGLTIDAQGRLISCEHGDRRVSAMPLNGVGGKITLADRYQGKRFNSPNDVVQHANGSYYFTDPPYGLAKKEADPGRETPLFGVYRLDPTGAVSLVVRDLTRPNGIAFSPDQKTMYVGQSDEHRPVIMAYPVLKDGSVGAGRLVYDVSPLWKLGLKGAPDGLKVDQQGNIWSSGPGGVIVLAVDPKTSAGTLLGRIETGEATANCGWGDDGSMLYITADAYLLRIKTTAKGAGW
ncbi:SMP-30/gluconolactonase/LRE family protein [Fibrella sp. HMF5335]|uniref:SMP-30/gluconolactonase/LRE family protein n=1 Tax=Fibrella rubiginis TaxID=2817060 RepID=A0A939K550_9BACT|nr:SMP-30/gluconolactonase/LRE family protein [Fibrella rubiginis]MBO0936085.1 SMP-30/gluconolactonase/LRE family protein [Fibrella rubiginis]